MCIRDSYYSDSTSLPNVIDYSPHSNPVSGVKLSTNLHEPGTAERGQLWKWISQERNKPSDSNTGDIRSGDTIVDDIEKSLEKL